MIYFLQRQSDKLIKIGFTKSPKSRIQRIQSEHGRLVLLGWIAGDSFTESRLHRRFKDFRISGEWFAPAPKLLEYIEDKTCNIPLSNLPETVFSLWENNKKLQEEAEHYRKMHERLLEDYNRLYFEEIVK